LIKSFNDGFSALGGKLFVTFWEAVLSTNIGVEGVPSSFANFYGKFDPPTGEWLATAPSSPEFANLGSGQSNGLAAAIALDDRFTLPVNGSQLPTVFKAGVKNLTTATDTIDFSVFGLPAGFLADTSVEQVPLLPGQTAEFGICIRPQSNLP